MLTSGKRLLTKLTAAALLVLVLGKFTACEPEDWMLQIECADCLGYAPDSADLIINLTINAENDSVPLTFYLGNYEDGVIDWQDTATTEEFYLYSKMNSSYTVRATYNSKDRIIEAFDADEMTLYNANTECGSPCYIIKGGIFDLRLLE
jgi:hypothetical protein